MNDIERDKIKKEAKEILASFSKSINKVKIGKKDLKAKEGGFRKEGIGEKCKEEFRKRMFDNAPNKDENFIIAEKKKW